MTHYNYFVPFSVTWAQIEETLYPNKIYVKKCVKLNGL